MKDFRTWFWIVIFGYLYISQDRMKANALKIKFCSSVFGKKKRYSSERGVTFLLSNLCSPDYFEIFVLQPDFSVSPQHVTRVAVFDFSSPVDPF